MWEPLKILERTAGGAASEQELIDVMHGAPETRVRRAAEIAAAPDDAGVSAIRWRLRAEADPLQVALTIERIYEVNAALAKTLANEPDIAASLIREGFDAVALIGAAGRELSLDDIRQLAESPDASERIQAVTALRTGGWPAPAEWKEEGPAILEPIILGDPDDDVMSAAVKSLSSLAPSRLGRLAAAALHNAGTEEEHDRAARVVAEMMKLGPFGIALVLRELDKRDWGVLTQAPNVDPDALIDACGEILKGSPSFHGQGVGLLSEIARCLTQSPKVPDSDRALNRCFRLLRSQMRGADEQKHRVESLLALESLDWGPLVHECRRLVVTGVAPNVLLSEACRVIGQRGGDQDAVALRSRCEHTSSRVRRSAVHALIAIAPQRATELRATLMRDEDAATAAAAFEELFKAMSRRRLARLLLSSLDSLEAKVAIQALPLVMSEFPERLDEILDTALNGPNETLIEAAVERITRRYPKMAESLMVGVIERRLESATPTARTPDRRGPRPRPRARRQVPPWTDNIGVLFGRLRQTASDRVIRPIVARFLQSRYGSLHRAALDWLTTQNDEEATAQLIRLARHPRPEIRLTTNLALMGRDHVGAHAELVSALDDQDKTVSKQATVMVRDQPTPPSVLAAWTDDGSKQPVWTQMRDAARRVHDWAKEAGRELLIGPIDVRPTRRGLGRTSPPKPGGPARILISHDPIVTCHPHGEEITRALALHELGHHVADFRSPGGLKAGAQARREGLFNLLNLLLDERLERRLRSRKPEWGILFDRLMSYAFARKLTKLELSTYAAMLELPGEEVRRRMRAGELPGRLSETRDAGDGEPNVVLRDVDLFRIPGLLPPLIAFTAALRCGLDPAEHPDERVGAAMRLVPANLKDLPHSAVLELVRQIAATLGSREQNRREFQRLRRLLVEHSALNRAVSDLLRRLAVASRPSASRRRDLTAGPRDAELEAKDQAIAARRAARKPGRTASGAMGTASRAPLASFDRLPRTETLPFDAARHEAIAAPIRRHIRRLRAYLERVGLREVEEYASRRGRRLDLARARGVAARPDPAILVHAREEPRANAYLGIVIDRSGSMHGEKIELAQSFAVLLAESARGIRGLSGHVSAFDDSTFYQLGDLRRCAVASLKAGGGNNDAAGLARAADLANASGKRHRLLIMISDGLPTECTVEALEELVHHLTAIQRIKCAQVAVDRMAATKFPHFIDLTGCTLDQAVGAFGRRLVDLTRTWR